MARAARNVLVGTLLALVVPAVAVAGPTDASVDVLWWIQDFELNADGQGINSDADDFAFRGDLFWGRYGVTAAQYTADIEAEDAGSVDYRNLDFVWKALAPDWETYLGIGVGWQTVDFDDTGFASDTAGPRVIVQGELGRLYGKVGWMPELDDFESGKLSFTDVQGFEWELGFKIDIGRSIHVVAGYRSIELDFDVAGPSFKDSADTESSGWLVGVGLDF
jgi:hypothetical protein